MTSILKVDTLQDSGGNTMLSSNGTGTFTSSLPNTGITMADQWRLNANFAGDATPIASNWERADTDSPGTIGSAMTESSGIFTFPTTGIYLITFQVAGIFYSAGAYHTGSIEVTTNNSTYSTASAGDAAGSTNDYQSFMIQFILDVTDTSNVKVRFGIDAVSGSQSTLGNTAQQQTGVTFIRLGDT